MALAFLSWAIADVLTIYSLFYGALFLATISNVIQLISYIAAVAVTINMALIIRNNAHRSDSSLDEFAFFSYMIPILIYAPSTAIWNYSTSDTNYSNYSERSFFVTLVFHYLCGVILIGISFNSLITFIDTPNINVLGASGRMLRLLAVSNINLLNLKQIFVRYMSHEIRQIFVSQFDSNF